MEPQTFELTSAPEHTTQNEIRIEIQDANHEVVSSHGHNTIHTIRLQSPGGSSHFVEGLVVTTNSQETPTSHHMTLAHGNTIIVDNDEVVLHNQNMTLGEATGEDGEQIICGPGIQMVLDENGETILLVPKQDSSAPVVVLNAEEVQSIENSYPIKQITLPSKVSQEDEDEMSSDDEEIPRRRCVVCLRRKRFTEDIFDHQRHPYYHISVLFTHLNIQVQGTPTDAGVCLECLNYLQRWHIFHSSVVERHEYARSVGASVVDIPLNFGPFETQFYKHGKKILDVKEIFNAATHAHYARRHLVDRDWDFFCEYLTHPSDPSRKAIRKFISGREKLSKFLCTICNKLIPKGKRGYTLHMKKDHQQSPVLYPCDICGKVFPEKVADASLVDYFDHWVSHFYSKGDAAALVKLDYDETPFHEDIFHDGYTTQEEESKPPTKKRKRPPAMSLSRREKYEQKISQIKDLLHNSPYQHLIRRELDEESLEYIAERLLTTKSNSSVKMKEIEAMTFSLGKFRSVFCADCSQSISGGKGEYFKHRKEKHQDKKEDLPLPCDICGQYFPEKDLTGVRGNYFPHWISHFYFEKCIRGECKETFPNVNLLKKHNHLHEERPKYPCPQCDKVLSKKVTLEQHIKTHMSEEEKKKHGLTCPICQKTITAPSLKAHMYSVHSTERPWKCEMCEMPFKHKSDLNGHRNAVHLGIKNYVCNICGKTFGHHCGLRVHIMTHENKRNHACPTCGKKFITMWHLKKHSVTHKEVKDIICPTCSKGFKKEEALQEHMTIHTGEMPFECHICGRKVRVLSNLYKHFMVHKKNKTYYSKKDGLPDPLDNYIVEQQKKKFSNKVVQNAIEKRAEVKSQDSSSISNEHVVEENCPEQQETGPEGQNEATLELKVNRSTRVTYRVPGRNPTVKKNLGSLPENVGVGVGVGVGVPTIPVPATENFIVAGLDGNYSLRLTDATSSLYSVVEGDKN